MLWIVGANAEASGEFLSSRIYMGPVCGLAFFFLWLI